MNRFRVQVRSLTILYFPHAGLQIIQRQAGYLILQAIEVHSDRFV